MKKTLKIFITISSALIIIFSLASPPMILELGKSKSCDSSCFHRPIFIDGDDDFTPENGVREGNGTSLNPYIISNWKIIAIGKSRITIKNTKAHFIIENCQINGCRFASIRPNGVFFYNVTNGRVVNCSFRGCGFGVLLVSSSDNVIENCDFKKDDIGISINGCPHGYSAQSNNNTIKNCRITKCKDGVYFCCLPSSRNNKIYKCHISYNRRGTVLDHCIHYTLIAKCNISNNDVGIEVISASSHNLISNNVFWKNDIHAKDNCRNVWDSGSEFGGNYWEGHDSSIPYYIRGAGNNIDHYPLAEPFKNEPFLPFFYYEPVLPLVDQEIFFDGTLSFVSGNSSYLWDFGDGNFSTGCKVKHVYRREGWYNVTLYVTNETKNNTFTRQVHVLRLHNGYITVSVDANTTIQDAINLSKPGYTIYVKNGTYYETMSINKPYLKIVGENRNTTVIDGCKRGDVVFIFAPFVSISNFTIKNSSEGKAGIQIGRPDYVVDAFCCSIRHNLVTENSLGINMSETDRNEIEQNVISDNLVGINMTRSYHNTLSHNTISSNHKGLSLIYGSNWNRIDNNSITANCVGVRIEWSHYNTLRNNRIADNKIGISLANAIYPDIEYNNICGNKKYGVLIEIEERGLSSINFLPNIKNNWWGSMFGPSWLIPIFGDRVWMRGFRLIKLRSTGIRFLSYPWLRSPLE